MKDVLCVPGRESIPITRGWGLKEIYANRPYYQYNISQLPMVLPGLFIALCCLPEDCSLGLQEAPPPLSMGILQARITGLLVHNCCSFFNRVYRTFGSHHFSGSLCCEGSPFYVNKIRLLFRSYCFMSVSAGNLKRVDGPFLLSLLNRWNVFQHGLCISECVSKWLVFCLPAQSTV